jgi:hypothetical protein
MSDIEPEARPPAAFVASECTILIENCINLRRLAGNPGLV